MKRGDHKKILLRNLELCDINPRDLGEQMCESGHSYGFAVRNYYLIHYVVSGKGSFIRERERYEIHAGEAFLIRPGEKTKYIADTYEPWHYIWIGFDGVLAKKLDELENPIFNTDESIFKKLILADAYFSMREQYVAGCVHMLLCDMFEQSEIKDNATLIKNYIETHYMDNIKIEELARSVRLNRKYLARIFKEKTGKSMREYILECRMREGEKLLNSGYNVNEIAMMLGYSDQATFSRAYKHFWNITPAKMLN